MKKILLTISVLVMSIGVISAQMKVGNNPRNVNPNAMFQVDAVNKGMLIPRIALTGGTLDESPLSGHIPGMIIYNISTVADVTPGFYYNDGNQWVRVLDYSQVPVFDTTNIYTKIKTDSTKFSQKVDSVFVNIAGDSIFIKDGYGTTTGFKLGYSIAKNGLKKSGDTVLLGGILTENTKITTEGKSLTIATAGDTVRFTGLVEGKKTDSLVVLDSTTSMLKKISFRSLIRDGIIIFTSSVTVDDINDVYVYVGTGTAHTINLPSPAVSNKGRKIFLSNFSPVINDENVCINITPSIHVNGEYKENKICSILVSSGNGAGSETGNTVTIVSDGNRWLKIN